MPQSGTLWAVGMGPGDPELVTLRAARILGAAPVAAFFAKRGLVGRARSIADGLLHPTVRELRFEYPFTTELPADSPEYRQEIGRFYDRSAAAAAEELEAGRDVALLCEGDPFFFGSAMYLFDRLHGAFRTQVVPGITSMSGCWTRAGLPMTHGDDVLTVLPGTLDQASLVSQLRGCDAAVIMKLGRNLPKVRAALDQAGMLRRAVFVAHGTTAQERVVPLAELEEAPVPYFSLVLVPGRQHER